jgi:hypothetical protein
VSGATLTSHSHPRCASPSEAATALFRRRQFSHDFFEARIATEHDNWRDTFPEFAKALEQTRETARRNALANIKAAGESGDWRASAEFLRLSFQADYRRSGNTVNVTAPGGYATRV